MSISTAFITRTREDLVHLSRDLTDNLISLTLTPSDHAHIWSIYGSHESGKSLVAETIASTLTGEIVEDYFEDDPQIFGFQGTAHSYFDDQAQRQYQFWDILAARPRRRPQEREQHQKDLIARILEVQEREGIIFIHNAPEAARTFRPTLEISITQERKLSNLFNPHARLMPDLNNKMLRSLNLKDDFYQAKRTPNESPMIRLVQMTIHHPEIFAPDFTKHLESEGYQPALRPF